jgi:hypothetical protein
MLKHLKMRYFLLLLSTSQLLFSQKNVNDYKADANKAISENNVEIAKNIYKEIVMLENNKDNWFNLANLEFFLSEKDSACEHYYKAYLLNDVEAGKIMIEKCPDFRNGRIKSIYHVEEKPKFIYEEKVYEIFDGKNLNPQYEKIMVKALKKSKILNSQTIRKIIIQIHISSSGFFDGKIFSVGTQENFALVRQEIMNIFSNTVKYIPARNGGIAVEVYERWVLPINFGG